MLSKRVPLRFICWGHPSEGWTPAPCASLWLRRCICIHIKTCTHTTYTCVCSIHTYYNEWLAAMTLHGNVPSILGWYLVAPWLWLESQDFALKTTDTVFNILIAPNILVVVVPLPNFAVEMATLMKSLTVSQSPDVRSASYILLWLFSPGLYWLLSYVANKFTFSLHYNTYFHITTSHITVPDHTSLKCVYLHVAL